MEAIRAIRGTRDILPESIAWWQRMERQLADVLRRFGYREIRTPLLETTALFSRSIGEQTDIVEKEMYTFTDRDGSSVTLRPEGTASAVRAYIEHSVQTREPVSRWYYLGPMFRHERPQKGRYRQFTQMGAELLGSADPAADVELIDLAVEAMRAIGLGDAVLKVNSLGDADCRPAYRAALQQYLRAHAGSLCEVCQRRLETTPLRVLDCKLEGCSRVAAGAPPVQDHLCAGCRDHFAAVRAGLAGLGIEAIVDHRMVRGLDYYSRTTFELLAEGLGSQNAVVGGGRYDGLVASLGGPAVPAVGFAAGLDRILLRLQETLVAPEAPALVFVVTQDEAAWQAALPLMQRLRRAGLTVGSDVRRGSLKAQMKRADKEGARLVLLLGEDERAAGVVTLRDMAAGEGDDKQRRIPLGEVEAVVRGLLGAGGGE